MPAYIALLRAVNLAGHKPVGMTDLRAMLGALGFGDPRSLLQSGNLIFTAPRQSTDSLERQLEKAAANTLALETDFFVRTAAEWADLVAANPFPVEATADPGHLVALCLREAPAPTAVRALQAAVTGREIVRAIGRVAYVTYPDGIGRSRLTNALVERKLGTRSTGRNWNTVLKLHTLSQTPPR